jgi:hypothetical protein
MASERSIRDYGRKQVFYDHRRVTDRLVATLRNQSSGGAQHAIAAFLSGYLNTDMRQPSAFETAQYSCLGKTGPTTPLQNASVPELNPHARLKFSITPHDAEQEIRKDSTLWYGAHSLLEGPPPKAFQRLLIKIIDSWK